MGYDLMARMAVAERDIKAHDKTLDEHETALKDVTALLNKVKGGFWVASISSGAITALCVELLHLIFHI